MKTYKEFITELNKERHHIIHPQTHKQFVLGRYTIHSGNSKRTGGHMVIVKTKGEK